MLSLTAFYCPSKHVLSKPSTLVFWQCFAQRDCSCTNLKPIGVFKMMAASSADSQHEIFIADILGGWKSGSESSFISKFVYKLNKERARKHPFFF